MVTNIIYTKDYVFVAGGSAALPQIEIVRKTNERDEAIREAAQFAKALYPAYFRFDLYRKPVGKGGEYMPVKSFSVIQTTTVKEI
jgi:hypothetical protein